MGICPIFANSPAQKQSGQRRQKQNEGRGTDRPLQTAKLQTEAPLEIINNESRKMSISETSNNNSIRQQTQKAFTKNASTGIGLSQFQKKLSSVFSQVNSLDSSSIVIRKPKQYTNEDKNGGEDFYTLIDKVVFVRKSMDCIKVSSPHGESELNCPPPSILSTFYVSEGLPLESIKQIAMGKIVQVSNSPVKVSLRLKCKNAKCGRQIKLVYAKSLITTHDIECDKCNQVGNWKLTRIESNVPVWGGGQKIYLEKGEQLENVPSPMRALGCVMCLRYQQTKTLKCGCLICANCAQQYTDEDCRICQAIE